MIMVEADNNIQQFCMVYFSEFKELPESPDNMPYIKMVNMTAHNGCKKLQSVNLYGKVALIKDTANCTLDKVVVHFKAAQAYGIIISTPRFKVDNIVIDRNDSRRVDLVVGFVTEATSNSLLSLMKPKEPLLTKLFTKKNMSFDFSLIVIWLVAVFTLGVGSYWSGLVKHEIYQHEVGRCTHVGAGATADEAARERSSKSDNLMDEESSLDVSPVLVTLFVICMGVMLLLLYFFFQYLVFFIIGMFALASVVSLIGVLEPLIYMVPLGTTRIPKNMCPCFHGPLEIRQLMLIVFAISLSVTWVVLRHHPQSWILQDLLGVAFSINMLKTLRMPNLMICSVLLVLLFFYDIFFVFITPFLTMKGESIMVEVARGGNSQEQLPMVLRVPHLNNESLSVCFSQFSLLGFGDILVPGLLVAYCHGFDLLNTRNRVYFLSGIIFYGVGLVVTFVALYVMRTPQPALLYLVPATLIPTVCIAWCRGQLREIWNGSRPIPLELAAPPPALPAMPSRTISDARGSPSPTGAQGPRRAGSPVRHPPSPVPASPSINYQPDVPLLSAAEHHRGDALPRFGPPNVYQHLGDEDNGAEGAVGEDDGKAAGAGKTHDAKEAGESSPLNVWGEGQPLVDYMSTSVRQS